MSIAKTLIQKEIARRKRHISLIENELTQLRKEISATSKGKADKPVYDEISDKAKTKQGLISALDKNINELETDLKKL